MEFSSGGGAPPQGMPQGLAQLLPSAQQMYGSQLLNRVQPSQELMATPQAPPAGMQVNINTPNLDALSAAQAATRRQAQIGLENMTIRDLEASLGSSKGGGLSGKGTGISSLSGQQNVPNGAGQQFQPLPQFMSFQQR